MNFLQGVKERVLVSKSAFAVKERRLFALIISKSKQLSSSQFLY